MSIFRRRQFQLLLPIVVALSFALVGSGCATMLVSSNDRVDRCVQLERQQYGVGSPGPGKKYPNSQLLSACAKWEGAKQLSDEGKWTGAK